MKDGTLLIAELLSVFLGLLSICILLFANHGNKLVNRLLAGNIAFTTLYMLTSALTQTDFFINYPHFFRAFYPFYLLISPLAYLYARAVCRDEDRLKKNDWLHFIPALLTAIQFIPFYRLGTSEKRKYIQDLFSNKWGLTLIHEGILPADVLSFIVNIISLTYMGFAIVEVRRVWNKSALWKSLKMLWKPVLNWTTIFIAIQCLFPLFFFLAVLFHVPLASRYFVLVFFNSIAFSILLIFLFVRPEILYGLLQPRFLNDIPEFLRVQKLNGIIEFKQEEIEPAIKLQNIIQVDNNTSVNGVAITEEFTCPASAIDNKQVEESENPALLAEQKEPVRLFSYFADYEIIVKKALEEQQLFLNPGFTIRHLSQYTEIPVHHLSALFNRHWGKGFNDYINICRINYLQENINNPEWKSYTIEGKGRQAGFNSRITLFKAIKKHTGKSPRDFFTTYYMPDEESL